MIRGPLLVATTLGAIACTQEVRVGDLDDDPRVVGRLDARGDEVGTWTWNYPNGVPRERGELVDGRRVGLWTQCWSNGELRSEGVRLPDAATGTSPRHGPWTFWHPNGAIAARGVYVNGRRAGDWEYSLDDGALDGDRSGIYHDDVRLADR